MKAIKQLLRPERLRQVPQQFSWVDQALVQQHFIDRCEALIADSLTRVRDKDTPNALTWGYASWGDTKVQSTTGEVDTLQKLWERYRKDNGDDEGFVAWLCTARAAEAA